MQETENTRAFKNIIGALVQEKTALHGGFGKDLRKMHLCRCEKFVDSPGALDDLVGYGSRNGGIVKAGFYNVKQPGKSQRGKSAEKQSGYK